MFDFVLETPIDLSIDRTALWDFIVLGGGPAGMNAALYATRKGLKTLLVSENLGGQIRNTARLDNYLGFDGIEAQELIQKFTHHIESMKIPILTGLTVSSVMKEKTLWVLSLSDGTSLSAKTILYALGGTPRTLGIPNEKELTGKGVSYCVTCDGPFYQGKTVIVVGGGNSAVDAVLDLSRIAKHIHLVHRSQFRADALQVKKMLQLPNVSVELEARLTAIHGEDHVTSVEIENLKTKTKTVYETDGVFIEIGHFPNVSLIRNYVEVNDSNEIIVDNAQMTRTPGLFAAGDVTDQPHKQVIIAAAEGAKAALSAAQYLNKLGE